MFLYIYKKYLVSSYFISLVPLSESLANRLVLTLSEDVETFLTVTYLRTMSTGPPIYYYYLKGIVFVAIIALDLAFSKEKAQRMLQQYKPELSDSIWHLRTTTAQIT